MERGQLTAGDRVQIGDEELFFLGKSGRVRISGKTYSEVLRNALSAYPTPFQIARKFRGFCKSTWYKYRQRGIPKHIRSGANDESI